MLIWEEFWREKNFVLGSVQSMLSNTKQEKDAENNFSMKGKKCHIILIIFRLLLNKLLLNYVSIETVNECVYKETV